MASFHEGVHQRNAGLPTTPTETPGRALRELTIFRLNDASTLCNRKMAKACGSVCRGQ